MMNIWGTGFQRALWLSPMHGKSKIRIWYSQSVKLATLISPRAMLHDEKVYPNPFEFNPDRFIKNGMLNPAVKDPMHAAFGFGRRYCQASLYVVTTAKAIYRVCPGRHMAFSAIWISIASILSVFNITKAQDENGNIIEPSHEYTSSLVWSVLLHLC